MKCSDFIHQSLEGGSRSDSGTVYCVDYRLSLRLCVLWTTTDSTFCNTALVHLRYLKQSQLFSALPKCWVIPFSGAGQSWVSCPRLSSLMLETLVTATKIREGVHPQSLRERKWKRTHRWTIWWRLDRKRLRVKTAEYKRTTLQPAQLLPQRLLWGLRIHQGRKKCLRKDRRGLAVTTFFRSGQNSQARPSNWTEPIVLMGEQTSVVEPTSRSQTTPWAPLIWLPLLKHPGHYHNPGESLLSVCSCKTAVLLLSIWIHYFLAVPASRYQGRVHHLSLDVNCGDGDHHSRPH